MEKRLRRSRFLIIDRADVNLADANSTDKGIFDVPVARDSLVVCDVGVGLSVSRTAKKPAARDSKTGFFNLGKSAAKPPTLATRGVPKTS
jgi:hypothetical protein